MIAPTAQLDEIDLLSLVADAQRGDREAMDQLCKRLKRMVALIAIGLRTRAMDIDDLIQEGLIGVCRAVETYRSDKGSAFQSYAGYKARNHMLDAIRHHGGGVVKVPRLAIQRGEAKPVYFPLARSSGLDYEPGEELGRTYTSDEETLDSFRSHLTGLDDRKRYVLEQYFVHERYLGQIAHDLDLSEARVCQMLHQAIAFIRERKELSTPLKPGRK
jgi:RNA polymerase sigma factor (sigma-70 family)